MKPYEMWKWNYITFLILLVPRMQAQVAPTDTAKLIKQIDDFVEKLDCPDDLPEPTGFDVLGIDPIEDSINPQIDVATRLQVQHRYEFLDRFLSNPDFAKKCTNINSLNERATPRTAGLVLELWKFKLCLLLFVFNQCAAKQPNLVVPVTYPNVPNPNRPSTCLPFEHFIVHPNGQWKKQMLLNCTTGNGGSTMIPMPVGDKGSSAGPAVPPKPEQQFPICTPIERYILLPTGKAQPLKQLNCTLPNQTSTIIPMPEFEDKPTIPVANPPQPTPGQLKNKSAGSGNPEIMISQDVKVNIPQRG